MNQKKDIKMKTEAGKFESSFYPVTLKIESNYFLSSRKELCSKLINTKRILSENEILEVLLSLHIILEVGVNAFFRNLYSHVSNLDGFKNDNRLDDVGFLDKTIFFLGTSKFNLKDVKDVELSNSYSKNLISRIKNFCHVRNLIIHGHSVSEISRGGNSKKSNLKSKLNQDFLDSQIKNFKEILDNYNFFVDKFDSHISKDQIKMLQNNFLSYKFLALINN